MSMPPINDLTQLLQLVQGSTLQSSRLSKKTSAKNKQRTQTQLKAKTSTAELQTLIQQRVALLAKGESSDEKKIKIFVEVLLIWEFGQAILQKANATHISEKVTQQIMGNESLKSLILKQF